MRVLNKKTAMVLLILGIAYLPCSSHTQTLYRESTRQALQAVVHLQLGNTTLAQALQTLSRQTGLTIEAADYLRARDLIVQMDGVTGYEALNALAESNEWEWQESGSGHISVRRQRVVAPDQPKNLSNAFRKIVPPDMRRFIGIDTPDQQIIKTAHNADKTRPEALLEVRPVSWLLADRTGAVLSRLHQEMSKWITPDVLRGRQLPFARLQPAQQECIVTQLVCEAMHGTNTPPTDIWALLNDKWTQEQLDPNKFLLSYSKGLFLIGPLDKGKIAFGESILSPVELPDPLRKNTKF